MDLTRVNCFQLSGKRTKNYSKISKADTIAISVPRSGDFAEIGRQFEIGATLAMEKLGEGHALFVADDGCDLDQSMLAAQDIKSIKPAIVTGMLCNTTAVTIADELREDKIPLLVAGARSIRLIKDRDREEWNLWRMSPGDDAPAETIAAYIADNLKDTAFALVDDGTIYGRSLTDAIRLRLNDTGMKPQFADTFRAAQSTQSGMLRRLQLASLPYLEEAGLVNEGIMIVMQPRHEENPALATLLKERNIKPSKAVYDGYAAIEVAISALAESTEATSQNLENKRFDSVLGPVKFDKQGKNIHNPYKLFIWRDGAFVLLDSSNNL